MAFKKHNATQMLIFYSGHLSHTLIQIHIELSGYLLKFGINKH